MGIQINGSTDRITAIDGTIDFVSNIGNIGLITASRYELLDSLTIGAGSTIIKTSNGRIGIGETTPTSLLNITDGSSASTPFLHLKGANDRASIRLENTADNPDNVWEIIPSRSGVSNTGFTIRDVTDSANRFVIDGSGNIGIGENSPTRNLHIDGTAHQSGIIIHTAGNHSTAIDMDSNRSSAAGGLAELNFRWNGTTVAQIGAYAGSDTTNKDDGVIHFGTAGAGTIAERMRITSDGKVSIGSPSDNDHRLCVADNTSGTDLTAGNSCGIQLQNKSTTDGTFSSIEWRTSGGGRMARIAGVQEDGNGDGCHLSFLTEPSSGGSIHERLRITNDGQILLAGATTSTAHADADDLVLNERAGGNVGMTFKNASTGFGVIYFADNSAQHSGRIQYDHGNNTLDLFAGGSEALHIDSSGNLTIPSTDAKIILKDGNNFIQFVNADKNFKFNNAWGAGEFTFHVNGAERLRINSSGQVSIGNNPTVDSNTLLHVERNAECNTVLVGNNAGAGCNLLLKNKSTSSDPRSTIGGLDASGQGTSSVEFWNLSDANNEGELRIKTRPSGGTQTTRMRVKSNGNTCFIDNSSSEDDADNALQVNGTNNTNNIDLFRLRNTGGSPGTEVGMLFEAGVDVMARISAYHQTSDLGGLKFWTSSSRDSPSERMRINKDGFVFVNTTQDGPHGSFFTIKATDKSTNGLGVQGTTGNYAIVSSAGGSTGDHIHFSNWSNSNNQTGRIKDNQSNVTYHTSSDYRLKDNIVSISDGITRVKQLNPVRHTWKNNSALGTVDGWIAHELDAVCPDAVDGVKDAVNDDGSIDPQSVDYGRITPLLAAALKEAIAKIETLETKVAALESA